MAGENFGLAARFAFRSEQVTRTWPGCRVRTCIFSVVAATEFCLPNCLPNCLPLEAEATGCA
jgi:hypothetical protein